MIPEQQWMIRNHFQEDMVVVVLIPRHVNLQYHMIGEYHEMVLKRSLSYAPLNKTWRFSIVIISFNQSM